MSRLARRLLSGCSVFIVLASLLIGSPAAPSEAQVANGDWVGGLGADGFALAGMNNGFDVAQFPMARFTGPTSRLNWEAPSSDPRALETPDQSGRVASGWYSHGYFVITITFHEDYAGPLRLYGVDFDSQNREQTVTVQHGPTVIASEDWSDFSDGYWMATDLDVAAGDYISIKATRTGGNTSTLSGVFLGTGEPSQNWTAVQGDWIGSYGSDGYAIVGATPQEDIVVVESARVSWYKPSRRSKTQHTVDRRALLSPADGSRQMAAMEGGAWVIGYLHFSEAYSGPISFYAVDWEEQRIEQTVKVTTAAQGQQSELMTGFQDGAWVTFDIDAAAGERLDFRVDRLVGNNATLSGVFLGGHGPPHVPTHTKIQGNWRLLTGADGYVLADHLGENTLPQATVTVSGNTTLHEEVTADQRGLLNGETSRKAASWTSSVYFHVDMSFNQAYSGSLWVYGVDWDRYDRSQRVELYKNNQLIETVQWNTMHLGAWAEFPIDVSAGDTLRIRPFRDGQNGASLSGVFLGGRAAGTYIGQYNDASGTECIIDGGNIFFAEPTHIEKTGEVLQGCYNLDTCVPNVPVSDVFGLIDGVQIFGCQNFDELLGLLDAASKPYEAADTATNWLFSHLDGLAAGVLAPIARPTKVGSASPPKPSGGLGPAGIVTAVIGISGVAEGIEVALDTDEPFYDRYIATVDQTVLRVGPGPNIETATDAEDRRRASAAYCVDELALRIAKAGYNQTVIELGFNTEGPADINGYVTSGPNQGKHLCEVIPIYLPGPWDYRGPDGVTEAGDPVVTAMPQTHRHIREALEMSTETVQSFEANNRLSGQNKGLRKNRAWHILTRGDNNYAPGGWYNAFEPCKSGEVGDQKTCDEFPFRTTLQSGSYNGTRIASVRLVDGSEQSPQAADITRLYSYCPISRMLAPAATAAGINPTNASANVMFTSEHNFFVLPLPTASSLGSQFVC